MRAHFSYRTDTYATRRTPCPRRLHENHALRLCLWRRCRLCGFGALLPADARQRIHRRQPERRHQRGARAGQTVLPHRQYPAAQLQTRHRPARPRACHRCRPRRAHHVRPWPHHDREKRLPGSANSPFRTGEHRQLGDRQILAKQRHQPRHPLARTFTQRNRRNPPALPRHGAGSLHPRRAVHGLLRPLPALRLLQQPRPQPGYLHQRLPLEI